METDSKDISYVRIDRTRKIPLTVLVRALGLVRMIRFLKFLEIANHYVTPSKKIYIKMRVIHAQKKA